MMQPLLSWGCMVVLALGTWWYYSRRHEVNRAKAKPSSSTGRKAQSDSPPKREAKKSKHKDQQLLNTATASKTNQNPDSPAVNSNNVPGIPVGGKKQKKARNVVQNQVVDSIVDTGDNGNVKEDTADSFNNKEFAKHLSSLKTGTSLTPPVQKGPNKKARRAQKAALAENSGPSSSRDLSTNSSTTGADADDDLSPTGSPEFPSLPQFIPTVASGDVSDMLEAPAAGPSVIRLTGSTQPVRPKPTQQKPFQVQESKKQRYARQKNEARKAEREEAEKQRRALLEKQLRTAREAENRPPRNGTARSTPREPERNPWKGRTEVTPSTGPTLVDTSSPVPMPQGNVGDSNNTALLDTFEPQHSDPVVIPSLPNTRPQANETKKGNVLATDELADSTVQSWADDLPSEEDQLKMIEALNGDGGWNTVNNKKAKKARKTKAAVEGVSTEESDIGGMNGDSQKQPLPTKSVEQTNVTGLNGTVKTNGVTHKPHPLDSDWAVA